MRTNDLKKEECRQVVVYSIKGACRAWSVHLYCPGKCHPSPSIHSNKFSLDCQTNYHHNFLVRDGMRTYYGGMPTYVQVGEHQFIEDRVITWWITSMLTGW